MQTVDKLLEMPCYIIDFLPRQVPEDCEGQFFEVERYFLNNFERHGLRDRVIRILLKLMCYYPVSAYWGEWAPSPCIAAASCVPLPPGAEQRSSTFSPSCTSKRGAAHIADGSCE